MRAPTISCASMSYRHSIRDIARSAAIGSLVAFLAGVLVSVLGSQTLAVRAYLEPGVVFGSIVIPFIPSGAAYWVVPEGGPLGFVFVALVCAFFFWSVLLGGVHYFWKRAIGPTTV